MYCVFGLSNASGISAQLAAHNVTLFNFPSRWNWLERCVMIQAGKKSFSSRKKTSLTLLAIQKLFAKLGLGVLWSNELSWMTWLFPRDDQFRSSFGTVKRETKTCNLFCNVTLLQIKTRYIAMLRILPPTDQNLSGQKSGCCKKHWRKQSCCRK